MYSERIGTILDQLALRALGCRSMAEAAAAVVEVAEATWGTQQVRIFLRHARDDRTVVLAERGGKEAGRIDGTRHLAMGTVRSMASTLVIALPDRLPFPASPQQVDRDLTLFARQAGWYLSGVDRIENLYRALVTRSTIAQAQGLLMASFDLGAEDALRVLRRRSQETQTRLADLAAAVVESDPDGRLSLLR